MIGVILLFIVLLTSPYAKTLARQGQQPSQNSSQKQQDKPAVTPDISQTALMSRAATASTMRITGGFIQYQGWMMRNRLHPSNSQGLSKDTWKKELEAMRRAGIDTIIIQRLEADGESFMPDCNDREAVDPTKVILDYADKHKMQVFVGLSSGAWPDSKVESADVDLLNSTRGENIRVANAVWSRYGKHRSFTGWYIPQEIWNINWQDEQNERIRTFYRAVSDHCKGISNGKPVAISPFFSPFGNAHEEAVTAVYTAFLKGDDKVQGAGIDIVMLQDGVGARCRNVQSDIFSVQSYFRAFLNATREASKVKKVALWGNLESFKTVQGGCVDNFQRPFKAAPADFNRLQIQLEAASFDFDENQPFFEKLVTFDFFHYMSPVHPGDTLAARQQLYSAYIGANRAGKDNQRKQTR
jgi:hypothetical protein